MESIVKKSLSVNTHYTPLAFLSILGFRVQNTVARGQDFICQKRIDVNHLVM